VRSIAPLPMAERLPRSDSGCLNLESRSGRDADYAQVPPNPSGGSASHVAWSGAHASENGPPPQQHPDVQSVETEQGQPVPLGELTQGNSDGSACALARPAVIVSISGVAHATVAALLMKRRRSMPDLDSTVP
jgi:hypothetical protein